MFKKITQTLCIVFVLISVFSCQEKQEVIKTSGGYTLEFHEKNEGPKAQGGEYVYFRYTERRNDEVMFQYPSGLPDQKFRVPVDLGTDRSMRRHVIEALMLMSPGDSATLTMHYSEEGASQMNWQEGDVTYFDLRLNAIKTEAEYMADMEIERQEMMAIQEKNAAKVDSMALVFKAKLESFAAGQLKTSDFPSGIKIHYLKEGQGEKPSAGNQVQVDYIGMFLNGNVFDTSIRRGEAFSFNVQRNQVIKGWDETLSNIKEGSEVLVIIPSDLAYGPQGAPPTIPPNETLAFYINFIKIANK